MSTRSTSRARRELERGMGRDPSREGRPGAGTLVEKVDPDTDAVKSLPETDVETEFHARLLLMKDVRQLDDDAAAWGTGEAPSKHLRRQ